MLLPVPLFRVVYDVAQVKDARLELGGRSDPLDQVVTLPRRDLRRGARGDFRQPDVIHGDIDPVRLPPFLREAVVPFLVEPGNEVRPYENLQLLRRSVGVPRDEDRRSDPHRDRTDARRLDEIAPGQ